jgi:hypothetical protein
MSDEYEVERAKALAEARAADEAEGMTELITVEKRVLRDVLDVATMSMDFGSGFLDVVQTEALRTAAMVLDIDPLVVTPANQLCAFTGTHRWSKRMEAPFDARRYEHRVHPRPNGALDPKGYAADDTRGPVVKAELEAAKAAYAADRSDENRARAQAASAAYGQWRTEMKVNYAAVVAKYRGEGPKPAWWDDPEPPEKIPVWHCWRCSARVYSQPADWVEPEPGPIEQALEGP